MEKQHHNENSFLMWRLVHSSCFKRKFLCAPVCVHTHLCTGSGWAGICFPLQWCLSAFLPLVGWGWARPWEGTQPVQLTQINLRDISYHRMAAQIQKLRKGGGNGGICYLQYLPSGANPTCAEALLPWRWLNITCWCQLASFCFFFFFPCLCATFCFCINKLLYLNLGIIFHLIFFPLSIWERGGIEQLVVHPVSSQSQPTIVRQWCGGCL